MATKVKKGKTWYWKDHNGMFVPRDLIPEDERKADKMVERIVGRVQKFQDKMKIFKEELHNEISAYLKELSAKYGEETIESPTIYNYNKTQQVELKLAKRFVFNEMFEIAEQKIMKLIRTWSEGSRKELIAVIEKKFQKNKKGYRNQKKLFDLCHAHCLNAVPRVRSSWVECACINLCDFSLTSSLWGSCALLL